MFLTMGRKCIFKKESKLFNLHLLYVFLSFETLFLSLKHQPPPNNIYIYIMLRIISFMNNPWHQIYPSKNN